jgi:hypothetical protein
MSNLGKLGISGKLVMSIFQWYKSCIVLNFGYVTVGFGIRPVGVISLLAIRFLVLILGNLGMLLMS